MRTITIKAQILYLMKGQFEPFHCELEMDVENDECPNAIREAAIAALKSQFPIEKKDQIRLAFVA